MGAGLTLRLRPPSSTSLARQQGGDGVQHGHAAAQGAVYLSGARLSAPSVPSGLVAAGGPWSWVMAAFMQAAQHPETRSLIIDMSRSSTREFVLALLPGFWTGGQTASGSSSGSGGSGGWYSFLGPARAGAAETAPVRPDALLKMHVHRVQVALSVLMFLVLSAISPRLIVEGGVVQ